MRRHIYLLKCLCISSIKNSNLDGLLLFLQLFWNVGYWVDWPCISFIKEIFGSLGKLWTQNSGLGFFCLVSLFRIWFKYRWMKYLVVCFDDNFGDTWNIILGLEYDLVICNINYYLYDICQTLWFTENSKNTRKSVSDDLKLALCNKCNGIRKDNLTYYPKNTNFRHPENHRYNCYGLIRFIVK